MSTAMSYVCPECDRVLRTSAPVTSGQKIRCPACQTVFAPKEKTGAASPIRRGRESDYSSRPPREDYDERPVARRRYDDDDAPRRPARRPRDDDNDDWDEGPVRRRPQRKKGKALLLIVLGSGALVLVAAVLVLGFVWPGWFRGGGGSSANLDALLAYVPPDQAKVLVAADLTSLADRNDLEKILKTH